jgi:hypothetical protein
MPRIPETIERERLLSLAHFLKTVPDANFDLTAYQSSYGSDRWINELKAHACGTAACAVGYMPFIDPVNWKYDLHYRRPLVNGSSQLDQYLDYFGVSEELYFFLFTPDIGYSSRSQVIDRLILVAGSPAGSRI